MDCSFQDCGRAAKREAGETFTALGLAYGVTATAASYIVKHKTWAHVP